MYAKQPVTVPIPSALEDQLPMLALDALAKGDQAHIRAIVSPSNEEQRTLRDRLEELGFLPGEIVRVVATAFPSGDPIAVRIGNTTFALRRHEAEMIFVERCT